MPLLDTKHQRAALLVTALGVVCVIALAPYATGLIGIPVLFVIFHPVHEVLTRRLRPGIAAAVVVAVAALVILAIGVVITGVIVNQAPQIARQVVEGPIVQKLYAFQVGQYQLGPELARAGEQVVGWLGTGALNLLGSATRFALNLVISLFGLFYMLVRADEVWATFQGYVPFSTGTAEVLRDRFRDVTKSTVIGTGLTALLQGTFVGLAFWITGLSNVFFWAVVTVIFAVLPVVGSGLVWGPGVALLWLDQRYGAAIGLAVWGGLVVANVDNVIRPIVFRRWAKVHPLVTIIGAFAGIRYLGLLGILVGPLVLSYFFELLQIYRREYLGNGRAASPASLPADPGTVGPTPAGASSTGTPAPPAP